MAKAVFFIGLIGIGLYIAHKASTYDPWVFGYSKEQVQDILADAKTTLPRRDGPGHIQIWSTGPSENGVMLNMQYSSKSPLLTCEAVITAIAPDETRVVPDCSSEHDTSSALSNTRDKLQDPMFEEHIQATLHKRDFNRTIVDEREAAIVLKNMGAMQNEAVKNYGDFLRTQDEFRR
jgi:hypothetical protein